MFLEQIVDLVIEYFDFELTEDDIDIVRLAELGLKSIASMN
mgnify:CR=1 FL=1